MGGNSSSSRHNKPESILQHQSLQPRKLSLNLLKEITNDFSDERLLGQGGFGKVYKVRLNHIVSNNNQAFSHKSLSDPYIILFE